MSEELSVTHGLYELLTPHLSCLSSPPPERNHTIRTSPDKTPHLYLMYIQTWDKLKEKPE